MEVSALNPWSWREPEREGKRKGSYEEHQTDADFFSAAKCKKMTLELGDTTILHPTVRDTITAFVFSCRLTEKLLPSALCTSQ